MLYPIDYRTLAFIQDYVEVHGASPTFVEIEEALGVGRDRAFSSVGRLSIAGQIERTPGKVRSIKLTPGPIREHTKTAPPTPAEHASEVSRLYAACIARDGPPKVIRCDR